MERVAAELESLVVYIDSVFTYDNKRKMTYKLFLTGLAIRKRCGSPWLPFLQLLHLLLSAKVKFAWTPASDKNEGFSSSPPFLAVQL